MIASYQLGLIVAVLIGIAFGFVLERAGFGRADKLAAQFYLRNMRVFKVMFTAIVTAMLGLVIASAIGVTDLREASESIASYTWIWPMVIGGFVLGAGFIISGYCPGTSVVAMASGHIDGLFTVAGVITGTFVYGQLFKIPAVERFHNSSEKGAWFLYDLLGISPQLLAAIVAIAAILAFIGAEKVESLMGGKRTAKRVRRYAFATVSALAVITLVTLAIPASPAIAKETQQPIAAADVARIAIEEPWRVQIAGNHAVVDGVDRPIAGRLVLPTSDAPPPPRAAAPRGVIAKPKKKGGGCSV
ncbi:MAG: DUF6691 family protein [Thermoanaerobaculia bacterium]